jgi:hypothetical protein
MLKEIPSFIFAAFIECVDKHSHYGLLQNLSKTGPEKVSELLLIPE